MNKPQKNLRASAPPREPSDKPALAPKLRFPEFLDKEGWTEKPLKAVAHINPTNDGLPESFIYIDLESVETGIQTGTDLIVVQDGNHNAFLKELGLAELP